MHLGAYSIFLPPLLILLLFVFQHFIFVVFNVLVHLNFDWGYSPCNQPILARVKGT